MNSPEWRAHRMKRHMPPVTYDARTRLTPRMSSSAGQIIPMKWFIIEFTFRPCGHVSNHITLSNVQPVCVRPVSWLGKLVFEINIAAYAHEKNSSSVLSHSKVPSIQHCPGYSISG